MRPGCEVSDNVVRIATGIAPALEKLGVTRVYARNVAVAWMGKRCNTPLLIADEVYNCLHDMPNPCSHGNMVCQMLTECNRWHYRRDV